MADKLHDDVLIPDSGTQAQGRARPLAAFVPIGLALFGVAVVLMGGVSVRSGPGGPAAVDQIITGSTDTTPQGGDGHDGAER